MENSVLLLPEKHDEERAEVAKAWKARGGSVLFIGKFWVKPSIGLQKPAIYGGSSFALVSAQILDLTLLSPQDKSIAQFAYK